MQTQRACACEAHRANATAIAHSPAVNFTSIAQRRRRAGSVCGATGGALASVVPAGAPTYLHRGALSTMTAKTITDLAVLFEHATAALNACVDRGMQLPFILCAVAPNGSVAAIRTDGVERELLVEHIEPEGFRLPITILVLDHAGEVACITIDAERTSFH